MKTSEKKEVKEKAKKEDSQKVKNIIVGREEDKYEYEKGVYK